MDKFQERYEEHQKRKKEKFVGEEKKLKTLYDKMVLISIMEERRSQRKFNNTPITEFDKINIEKSVLLSPSSCNRQAIEIFYINPKEAEKYLVGGKNWIKEADKVILLFANKDAYKSPNEKAFMPYLDAGFVGQNIYLMCEALNIGCCYVNPNIRKEDINEFNAIYNHQGNYFCGAVAIGNYTEKAKEPPKRKKL